MERGEGWDEKLIFEMGSGGAERFCEESEVEIGVHDELRIEIMGGVKLYKNYGSVCRRAQRFRLEGGGCFSFS